jgi:hypothetical protein
MASSDKVWKQHSRLVERVHEIETILSETPAISHKHVDFLDLMIEREELRVAFWRKLLTSLSEKGILAVLGMSLLGLAWYIKTKLGGGP